MIVLLVFALAADPTLIEAEEAYHRGLELQADSVQARPHFTQAAARFESGWEQGYQNPDVAAMIAQSYLLADRLPQAIRAYREALRRWPSNAKLRRGLNDAREQVIYPQTASLPAPHESFRFTNQLSSSKWLLMVFGMFVGGWIAFARAWVLQRGGWTFAVVGWVFAVAILVTIVMEQSVNPPKFVVVSRDGVTLRQGNAESYPARMEVPLVRGIEATLIHERGGWAQLELSNGAVGWLPHSAVLIER